MISYNLFSTLSTLGFILGEHMEALVLSYAKKWKDTLNLCVQSPAEKCVQSAFQKSIVKKKAMSVRL